MKKQFFTLLFCGLAAAAGAQSRKAVHDAATAPDRPAQSAKADLYVQDKTRISDDQAKAKKATAAGHRKKKVCGSSKCCRKS